MMTDNVQHPGPRRARSWPVHWLAVLLTGVALFGLVLAVLISTGDPVYVPCLLLLGAAVVPATFTTLVAEVQVSPRLSLTRIVTAATLGGVVGGVLAGQLEFDTARALGSLPYLVIGLIEESAKLAIPVALFAWRRPRLGALDGLVLGVAVGSGFAALETMGYAFVALLSTGGHLQPVESLLVLRALGSLGGHAAWTGLATGALFAIRDASRRRAGVLRFVATLAIVVSLHAQWDASAGAGGYGDLAVGALSLVLLATTAWWIQRHQKHGLPGRSASTSAQPPPAVGSRPIIASMVAGGGTTSGVPAQPEIESTR
jgi:RsiW-degrading membrane proteinase PrsW (M82 family)